MMKHLSLRIRITKTIFGILAAAMLVLGGTMVGQAAQAPPVGPLASEATGLATGLADDILDDDDIHVDAAAVIWHTQSLNNRGSDVKAIQYLLRKHGKSVSVDGVFGSGTDSAVKSFQSSKGLAADGIVGPSTWGQLVVTAKSGASGEHVKAIQMLLNEKRGAGLAVDGVFGSGTDSKVKAFQTHMGLSADGIVGPTTWKYLVWHYEQPNNGIAGICSHYEASKRWGTAAAVGQLEAAGAAFYTRGKGEASLGDLSLEHGGDIVGHASHEVGLDADVWLINTARSQCSTKCYYTQSCYDKVGTLQLCQDLRAKASGHVKLVYLNDPYVRSNCPASYYDNHDDHIHIRYCEKVHPNSAYAC